MSYLFLWKYLNLYFKVVTDVNRSYNKIIVRHCGLVGSVPAWDRTGCEFDSWQCQIYIPCSLSLRLLGSLRGSLGTYGLTQKLCWKKIRNVVSLLRLQILVEAAAFYPRSHRLAADDYGDDEDENQDGSTSGGQADDQVLVDTVASKRQVGSVTTVENKQIRWRCMTAASPALRRQCHAY